MTRLKENLNQNTIISIQENATGNAVCEMPAIFRAQYVKIMVSAPNILDPTQTQFTNILCKPRQGQKELTLVFQKPLMEIT